MQKTNTLAQSPAKLDAFQTLARVWSPHLSASELSFLLWFIDATVSWGRTWLDISLRQMADEGLWTCRHGKPQLWQGPCPLSLKTLQRTLIDLRGRGIIAITESPQRRSARYTINLEWEPPVRDLPVPKRVLNRGAKLAEKCGQNDHSKEPNCSQSDHSHYNLLESKPTRTTVAASGNSSYGDSGEEVIRQIQSRPKKPSKDVRKAETITVWKDGWVEGQYDSLPPALSAKERGQLSRAIARWPAEGAKAVRWSITNWRQVIKERFGWMTTRVPPARPDPGFLLKFIGIFNEAYAREQAALGLQDNAFTDKGEFDRLIETGVTVEEAWKEMGRREAHRDHGKKMERERADLAAARRAMNETKPKPTLVETWLTTEQRKAILDSLTPPEPKRMTRDYWSEENPPPLTDFGEWEDDE